MEQLSHVAGLCAWCRSAFPAGTSVFGCCSAECVELRMADRERVARKQTRIGVAFLVLVISTCSIVAAAVNVRDIVASSKRMDVAAQASRFRARDAAHRQAIAAHERRMKPIFAMQPIPPAVAVAAISTADGTSEPAFPTLRSFCEALLAIGRSAKKDGHVAADRADAIGSLYGVTHMDDGDVVAVVLAGKTTCNGEMRHFPADISFVRDDRLHAAGWMLSRDLSGE